MIELGLIVGIIALILGLIGFYYQRQSTKVQKYLSELNENQIEQIKILKKQIKRINDTSPQKIMLEKEKLELKKREQENKEKRQQLNALMKTINFIKKLGE